MSDKNSKVNMRFPDISEAEIRALFMGPKHPRSIDEDVRRFIEKRSKK